MSRFIPIAALLTLFLLPLTLGGAPTATAPQDIATLRDALVKNADEATEEMISEIAEYGTREALDALLAGYDKMGSIYAKLLVVRVLSYFDGGEAAQPALQHMMDVATQSRDKELRDAAILGLRECRTLGGTFLVMIVESPSMVETREMALQAHIDMGKADLPWYKKLYETKVEAPETDKKKKRKKKGQEEEEKQARSLNSIRLLAFEAVQESLDAVEVLNAAEQDPYDEIRLKALRALHDRGEKVAEKIARDVLDRGTVQARTRVLAAEILAEIDGEKIGKEFIDLASKFPTPDQLRIRMAELVKGFESEKLNKLLTKDLTKKGKPYYKRFVMRATSKVEGGKVDKALEKSLKDKELSIRTLAAELLGERKVTDAVPDLRKLVAKGKNQEMLVAVMGALGSILGDDTEWQAELEAYISGNDRDVRNAAITLLDGDYIDLLGELLVHNDWSTRLNALKRLEEVREAEVVPLIIERMGEEVGRMQHEFAEVLWRLTGQPWRTRTQAWKGWWEKEGASFEIIKERDLKKLAKAEEERRLKQVSAVKSEFFGVRIISQRVIFVLDISGSMNWELGGEGVAWGEPIRMEVATRELIKVLKNLHEDALFNMIVFSSDVSAWLDDGIAGSTAHTREEAVEYVSRLGAGGGTNIYGSLEAAFEDSDVDTIVFLSDGEPSVGAVTDPSMIREDVAAWNENRGIKIHTIAIGSDLELLEWLSEDSGGSHVTYQ
ncbi:MAG: HEAT repeat protein [Planctomycetota bacterium]|jgi:HEAT repeat protein